MMLTIRKMLIKLKHSISIKDHSSIEIELPFADQFWGGKMGVFTDKYSVRWMLHGQDYTAIQQ